MFSIGFPIFVVFFPLGGYFSTHDLFRLHYFETVLAFKDFNSV